MNERISIPVLNMFNYAKMPLGKLELDKEYAEKIVNILKDSHCSDRFMIGFISKGEDENFEIIGCCIMPDMRRE